MTEECDKNLKDIKVFISSREMELKRERDLCEEVLKDLDPFVRVVPIRSEKFIAANEIDLHLKELIKSDIVVSILNKTISQVVIDEIDEALKKGKPLLVFIRKDKNMTPELKKTIECLKQKLRIRNFKNLNEFKQILKESIIENIKDYQISPCKSFTNFTKMYSYSINIMENAKRFLYIVQRTPSILFGPKEGHAEDNRFFSKLNNWIDTKIKFNTPVVNSPKLTYIYSIEHTKSELDNYKRHNMMQKIQSFQKNLLITKDFEKQSNYSFRLFSASLFKDGFTNPFIIGDSEFGIWFMVGKSDFGLSIKDSEMAKTWVTEIDEMVLREEQERGWKKSISEHFGELGLSLNYSKKCVNLKKNLNKYLDTNQKKGHDLNHFLRVYDIGMIIANIENADIEIIEPSLLLHDISYPEDKDYEHNILSAENAMMILKDFDYDNNSLEKISGCIKSHSTLSEKSCLPKTLEEKIVFDSDKCDSVGVDGIKRVNEIYDDPAEGARWYLNRIIETKKKYKIYTEIGRKLINRRLKVSLNWCKEILGNDYKTIINNSNYLESDIKF